MTESTEFERGGLKGGGGVDSREELRLEVAEVANPLRGVADHKMKHGEKSSSDFQKR